MAVDPSDVGPAWADEALSDVVDRAGELMWRDRDGEIAALVAAERRGVTLAHRLIGQDHAVEVETAHGSVTGNVAACVDGFVVITGVSEDRLCAVVSLAAVATIRGLSARPRPDGVERTRAVAQARGTVNRWLAHAVGTRVVAHGRGWSVAGELSAVFADHLELIIAHTRTAVPLQGVEVVLVTSS